MGSTVTAVVALEGSQGCPREIAAILGGVREEGGLPGRVKGIWRVRQQGIGRRLPEVGGHRRKGRQGGGVG